MLTAEQMEAAHRELIEECRSHPDTYSFDNPCYGCRFLDFCNKFVQGDGAPWHWKIEDWEDE